jgi:hypothetical protein
MAECLLYLTNRAYLENKAHRTAQNTKCVAFTELVTQKKVLLHTVFTLTGYIVFG